MKNILILTIGQRDLQLIEKDKYYYPIDKKKLQSVQRNLKDSINNLKWIPITKLEKENDRIEKTYTTSKVTFPLIEHLFLYLKNSMINIDKIYLFYTNRQHSKKESFMLNSEPYLFSDIFKYLEKDILQYYEISPEIEYINIGENISNIESDNIYPFLGEIFKNISYEKIKQVYIAAAGGIPTVRGVIENLGTLYFSENCIILNQKYGTDIELSKSHLYHKYYRDYNQLRYNIEKWDFAKAFEIYKEIGNQNDIAFKILNMINNLLFKSEYDAKNILKKIIKKEKNKKKNIKYKKINRILEQRKENSAFLIYLKFLQVYRTKNYWGASTILVTLLEVLSIELIKISYVDILQEIDSKKYFDLNKLTNKSEIINNFKIRNDLSFHKEQENLILNNWPGIIAIINHLEKTQKGNFKDIQIIIQKLKKLKYNRNNFIHNGLGSKITNLNNFLDLEVDNTHFSDSNTIRKIYIFLLKLNPNYFNWLEFFEELLLKEIKELKPNIR